MGFYYGIFLLIAMISFMEIYGLNRREVLKLYILSCLGLFVMSFIRWENGTDWDSYIEYFQTIPEIIHESNFEIGYSMVNGIAKVWTGDYTVALFLCAAILFGFQSPAIWKLSPYPMLSLLFLFGINFGSVFFVRQTIAAGILLYSVIFIKDRRFWPFLACLLLAISFHRSSIVFLIAWWVYRWRIHPYLMIILLFVSMALSGIADSIMQSLGTLVGGAIQVKIDAYTGELRGEMFGLSQSFAVIIAKALFSKLLLIVFSMIMLRRVSEHSPEFRGYFNLYWMGAVLYFLTISISPGLARMAYSFDILQIILLPYIIREIQGRELRIFAVIASFMYIALRLYTVTTGGYYDLFVPYRTIFG